MVIEVLNIPVQVHRKDIKNMHLYVKPPDGHVEVSAPKRLSDESITLFVRSKIGWIRRQQSSFASQLRQTERQYVSGETLYVLGQQYFLRVSYGSKYSLNLSGDEAHFIVREGSTTQQRENWIHEWYRSVLKDQIERLLPKWERRTKLFPDSWQTKYMTTKWGTCNNEKKKLWFNLQLAKKPLDCIEYVILHELIHLKVKNHGPEFIREMDEHMPFWREIRKKLNDTTLDYMETDKKLEE